MRSTPFIIVESKAWCVIAAVFTPAYLLRERLKEIILLKIFGPDAGFAAVTVSWLEVLTLGVYRKKLPDQPMGEPIGPSCPPKQADCQHD